MNSYRVYIHTFPNGKFYVGATKNTIQERKNCGYQHNKEMKRLVSLYGWRSITTTIIKDNLTQEEAFELEKETITKLRQTEEDNCLNISSGGKHSFEGAKHTEEYKKHMSERMKGVVFSEETLERMRRGHDKEKVSVSRTVNGEITIYESLGKAAESVNGYKSNIKRACINHKPYKGYVWALVERG